MVLGVPVVCSNSFSMTEQVGKAGIFFDPMNIDDIAEKIYRVWTDNDLTTQLIHEANRLAPELSVERFGERWTNLVDDTLQEIGK
jgi:glycosyltransferase involved in cell wall biosynthesis